MICENSAFELASRICKWTCKLKGISYFKQLAPTGILLPRSSPRDGIFNPAKNPLTYQGIGGLPEQETSEILEAAHNTPVYRKFLQHPVLRSLIREFTGWRQEIMVDRAMLRHNCPNSLSTGIHYDQYFLRAGEAEFLTAWVPIGDCPATGGGLMYLENSTNLGKRMEKDFMQLAENLSPEERINAFNQNMNKDGFLSHDAEEFGRIHAKGMKWLIGDYEAGDVVFHNPYIIHAATKNEDKMGRIRLASDLRFYEGGASLDKRWMKIWQPDDGL